MRLIIVESGVRWLHESAPSICITIHATRREWESYSIIVSTTEGAVCCHFEKNAQCTRNAQVKGLVNTADLYSKGCCELAGESGLQKQIATEGANTLSLVIKRWRGMNLSGKVDSETVGYV